MKKLSVVFALCIAVLLAGCADSGRSSQGEGTTVHGTISMGTTIH